VLYVLIMVGALVALYSTMGAQQGRAFLYHRFVPAFMGVLFAVGGTVLAAKFGIARGYVFAAVSVVLSIGLPCLSFSDWHTTLGLLMGALGALALLTGLIMFARFLRKYPVADAEVSVGGSEA